ncbi:T9SS type A sorting domain-containing protein [Jejudonia soesokkakensis]|uniref:T9SS type A sorting domain-containing protein n=1 Tax=Jejudonia soesokkakensis TaxID=1323432 RepID=A0ABW2MPE4_9FLAO
MKKITKNEFSKNLAKYGALSLAIAGVADASGQVIYTDLDPDYNGMLPSTLDIDFNGDSVTDVSIVVTSDPGYPLAQVAAGSNGVIAASNSGFYYASNLSYSAVIGSSGAFNSFGDLCADGGFNGSQFCGNQGDPIPGYVGIQFLVDGNTHYGWVQLGAPTSSEVNVLDYAFEATPNTPILAGVIPVAGVDDNAFEGFSHFVDANRNLSLSANTPMSNVSVYDVLGKVIITSDLSNTNETINLASLNSGVYIARVTIEGQVKSFKIAIK